jgi:hypothetical protein
MVLQHLHELDEVFDYCEVVFLPQCICAHTASPTVPGKPWRRLRRAIRSYASRCRCRMRSGASQRNLRAGRTMFSNRFVWVGCHRCLHHTSANPWQVPQHQLLFTSIAILSLAALSLSHFDTNQVGVSPALAYLVTTGCYCLYTCYTRLRRHLYA